MKLTKAEEYACRYAGFSSPPTRRDCLENREQKDIYYAVLDGYERAKEDLIEKAIAWLTKHVNGYIVNCSESYPDAPFKAVIGDICWEHLKDYLKNV